MLITDAVIAEGFFLSGLAAGDQLGFSVRNAGDLNGDGLDDFVIGAPYHDAGGVNAGAAFAIFGTAGPLSGGFNLAGLNGSNGLRLDGQTGGGLGYSVSGAGDINGDGYADLILGAPFGGGSSGDGNFGTIYIALGRSQFPAFIAFDPFGQAANDYDLLVGGSSTYRYRSAGEHVGSAGDLNGDGIDEYVFGSSGSASEASPIVVASDFSETFEWNFVSPIRTYPAVRSVVNGAGDVNGDGIDDVLISGEDRLTVDSPVIRVAFLVYGSAGGSAAMPANIASLNGTNGTRFDSVSQTAGSFNNRPLGAAGDFNGDGIGDFIVGDAVVFGNVGGFGANFDLNTLNGTNGFRLTGTVIWSAVAAGDVNGDGFGDLIIGNPQADPDGRTDAGSAWIVYGGAGSWGASLNLTTLSDSQGRRLDGAAAGDRLGYSVSGAGDLNADGFADVVIGAPGHDGQGAEAGIAYVLRGGPPVGSPSTQIGTAQNDTLTGTSSADQLYGLGGDDILLGRAGADTLQGGAGSDTASYAGDLAPVLVNLTSGLGHWNNAEGDVLTAIENLIGTDYNDVLVGDANDNRLQGGAGNDYLYGQGGTNILSGGLGADWLYGGGVGQDTADYGGNFGAIWVDLSTGVGRWNYAEGDSLSSIDNVIGTQYGDKIIGDGGDNRLHGGLGGDVLQGGGGSDTADYAGDFGAVWVDLSTGQGRWNYAEGDTLSGIENLTGTQYGDRLTGDGADNRLHGGLGGDILEGGAGLDTADYAGNFGAVWVDLAAGVGRWNYAEGDSLYGIENVVGTIYGDRIAGNSANNVLTGGGGTDAFLMGAGFGQDRITDFEGAGAAFGDSIGFAAGLFANYTDLMSHAVQQGADVVITAGTNTLTLTGVQRSALHPDDFDFAAPAASSASDADAFLIPEGMMLPPVGPPEHGLARPPAPLPVLLPDHFLTLADDTSGPILHFEPLVERHGHDGWM